MKVVTENVCFHPFKMTIQVESLDELLTLYHMANVSGSAVDISRSKQVKKPQYSNVDPLYYAIVEKLKAIGEWHDTV